MLVRLYFGRIVRLHFVFAFLLGLFEMNDDFLGIFVGIEDLPAKRGGILIAILVHQPSISRDVKVAVFRVRRLAHRYERRHFTAGEVQIDVAGSTRGER